MLNQKVILQEAVQERLWKDILLPRLKETLHRKQSECLRKVKDGKIDEAHQTVGWCEAITWVIDLPKKISAEGDALQEGEINARRN